jgi:hypothetical protein
LQAFKGFHQFLQVRKAVEIDAVFGVRLTSPVDEFNASRHVGDDSPTLQPPPTPERVVQFFGFLKTRGRDGPQVRPGCSGLCLVSDAVSRWAAG